MNRNRVQLMVAVLATWAVGGLGGLAAVPPTSYDLLIGAAVVVPLVIALVRLPGGTSARPAWRAREDSALSLPAFTPPPRLAPADFVSPIVEVARPARGERRAQERARAIDPARPGARYRRGWLALTLVAAMAIGIFNIFLFAATVVSLDGVKVHATVVSADLVGEDGSVACTIAGPDGRRIPGALFFTDSGCQTSYDVLVDPHGIVNPVSEFDDVENALAFQLALLAVGLGLCVVATRPRRPVRSAWRTP